MAAVDACGAGGLESRIAALAARIPEPLGWHARIAYDFGWTWRPGGDELFRAIDPRVWEEVGGNPVRLLATAPFDCLERAAADRALVARAEALAHALDAERARPPASSRTVAFFCAEFAVHASLPIYGGGLGVLAGDLLKEASDAAMPVVGVGLLYSRGYFRQRLDREGRQHEYWSTAVKEMLPIAPVGDAQGTPLTISVVIGGRDVRARIWRAQVGRVPLFLLDAGVPENGAIERWITAQLYVSESIFRLKQYALLGLGGVRALGAMGVEADVYHVNEGHPALAAVELGRAEMASGARFDEALARVRSKVVFTTHTPVAAGNERYADAEIEAAIGVAIATPEVLALGRAEPGRFGMSELALRVARSVNAVSARHEETARAMWRGVARADAPIRHVTNGVHLPTWMAAPMRALFAGVLGDGWEARAAEPETWAALDRISDEQLWRVRRELRRALIEYARARSELDRLARGEPLEYVEAAAQTFDPEVLTIGFARRVASYKRLHLLIHDAERALALLAGPRAIQVVLAGKAHPHDQPAKDIIEQIFALKRDPRIGARVVFLEDYDLAIAQVLVAGCDVWVNLPRPPLEASGTSGMKVALNGGLNLAVLDGWWPEAWDGTNGWAIATPSGVSPAEQDAHDASALYDLIEREIVPTFHARDANGIPRAWLARVRASMRTIAPRFCAGRMLREYATTIWNA